MNRLPRLMRGRRVALAMLLGANGLGQALAAAAIAFATRHVFDSIGAIDVSAFAALLAAASTISVLRYRERVDAEKLGQDYVVEIRERLFRHLLDQRARDVSMRSKGGTLLKFVGDLTAMRLWVTMGLARLWVMGTTLAGAFAALAVLDTRLALVVCLPILLGASAIVFSGTRIRETAREARRHRARLTGDVAERLANLAVVQAFGQSEREWRRVRRRGRVLRDAMIDRARAIGRVRGLAELTTGVATVAALACAFATRLW